MCGVSSASAKGRVAKLQGPQRFANTSLTPFMENFMDLFEWKSWNCHKVGAWHG